MVMRLWIARTHPLFRAVMYLRRWGLWQVIPNDSQKGITHDFI